SLPWGASQHQRLYPQIPPCQDKSRFVFHRIDDEKFRGSRSLARVHNKALTGLLRGATGARANRTNAWVERLIATSPSETSVSGIELPLPCQRSTAESKCFCHSPAGTGARSEAGASPKLNSMSASLVPASTQRRTARAFSFSNARTAMSSLLGRARQGSLFRSAISSR